MNMGSIFWPSYKCLLEGPLNRKNVSVDQCSLQPELSCPSLAWNSLSGQVNKFSSLLLRNGGRSYELCGQCVSSEVYLEELRFVRNYMHRFYHSHLKDKVG